MSRITRFAVLAGVLSLTLWLAGSRPALATPSCYLMDGSYCSGPSPVQYCLGDDQQIYQCDCTGNRLNCPW